MNPWVAIVGRGEDRRTATTEQVCAALAGAGLRLGGFIQQPVAAGGTPLGWDAVSVGDGARLPLVRANRDPELCNWRFDRQDLETCRAWATAPGIDVAVIEVGTLETRRLGHWRTLQDVLSGPPRVALLSMRPRAVAEIALGLPDPHAGLEPSYTSESIALFIAQIHALATGDTLPTARHATGDTLPTAKLPTSQRDSTHS